MSSSVSKQSKGSVSRQKHDHIIKDNTDTVDSPNESQGTFLKAAKQQSSRIVEAAFVWVMFLLQSHETRRFPAPSGSRARLTEHIWFVHVINCLHLCSGHSNTCSHGSREVTCFYNDLSYCEGFANSLRKGFNAAQWLAAADRRCFVQKLAWRVCGATWPGAAVLVSRPRTLRGVIHSSLSGLWFPGQVFYYGECCSQWRQKLANQYKMLCWCRYVASCTETSSSLSCKWKTNLCSLFWGTIKFRPVACDQKLQVNYCIRVHASAVIIFTIMCGRLGYKALHSLHCWEICITGFIYTACICSLGPFILSCECDFHTVIHPKVKLLQDHGWRKWCWITDLTKEIQHQMTQTKH